MFDSIRKKIGDILLATALLILLAIPFALNPERKKKKTTGSEADEKLIIISPHWEGVRHEFERGFKLYFFREFGKSIDIEWLNVGGTADIVKFIGSEFARNHSTIGVDLVYGGGIEAHMHMADRGYLSPVDLPEGVFDHIPKTLFGMRVNDAQSRWFSAALSGFGIIYNRPVLKKLSISPPETWEDLARPEMLTWVGSGDFRYSGSTHMVYEIILQAYGWRRGFSIIMRMGANIRSFSRSSTDVPRDTALGEIACGMALDSYAWNQIARIGEERLGYVLPPKLTIINPDAVAILKGAPNKEAAAKFIQYVLSLEGQSLWMLAPKKRVGLTKRDPNARNITADPTNQKHTSINELVGPHRFALTRMSVRRDIYKMLKGKTPVKINPFSWKGSFEYDDQKASKRWDIINNLLGAALIDNHDRLQALWRELIQAGLPSHLVNELTKPPISEDELMRTAERWNKDPKYRSHLRVKWVKHFRDLYNKIATKLEDIKNTGSPKGKGCTGCIGCSR